MRFHGEAMATLTTRSSRLHEQQTAAVLCDAPAVPLVAARRAGIPGFLMSNFTWADIYAPHARAGWRGACDSSPTAPQCYRQATATFRVEPAMSMSWLSPHDRAGHGREPGSRSQRRAPPAFRLARTRDKLVYIYIGRYGQNDLDWSRLGRFTAQGIHFLGYQPGPRGKPDNFHLVPSADWPGGDLIASSDAIVAKAGYGTVCEAMARGTPMIYPPRSGFAEFRSLDRARAWGGGVPISSRNFFALKLDRALRTRSKSARSRPIPHGRGRTDRQPPDVPVPSRQREDSSSVA